MATAIYPGRSNQFLCCFRLTRLAAPSENWDDDFEFQPNASSNGVPPTRISTSSSQVTEDWDTETPSHSRQSSSKTQDISTWNEPGPSTPTKRFTENENWDDDFEDKNDSPAHKERNWDEDFDADDDDEEDRTVTAKSRRTALSRLGPPVPPVPPLPERPFPRSPTASIFSVPTTSGRDSVAAYSSTTHLRPTDAPQKERERRRLRKKSRPQEPQQVYYPAMNSSRESIGTGDVDRRSRPITPQSHRSPSPSPGQSSTPDNRNSLVGLPSSPPSKTPLLSRLGSVKKRWAVRKKRASSTPSEVLLQEGEDVTFPNAAGTPAKSTTNWFFRATSSSSANSACSSEVNNDKTPKASRVSPRTSGVPEVPPLLPAFDPANQTTPSKLIKRKSLGFVQLRPRNNPINDTEGSPSSSAPRPPPRNPLRTPSYSRTPNRTPRPNPSASTSDIPSDLEAELRGSRNLDMSIGQSPSKQLKTKDREPMVGTLDAGLVPPSQSRQGSYGGIGLGRAPPDAGRSTENVDDKRSRKRSFSKSSRTSRARSKSKSRDPAKEDDSSATESREGSRGFMGSVRKISFGGSKQTHKRTKSGVSLASVTEGVKKSLERAGRGRDKSDVDTDLVNVDSLIKPASTSKGGDNIDVDNETSKAGHGHGLLPPIELSPPSPPSLPKAGVNGISLNSSPSASSSAFASPSQSFLLSKSSSTSTVVPGPKSGTGVSPLTASLGRSTIVTNIPGSNVRPGIPPLPFIPGMTTSSSMPSGPGSGSGYGSSTSSNVPRRNSMGDLKLAELKIPARISQAQVGLRRDLGMVKEFAGRVEQLKSLQITYNDLIMQMQGVLDARHARHNQASSNSRAASPTSGLPSAASIFRPLSRSRLRSNTNINSESNSPTFLSSPLALSASAMSTTSAQQSEAEPIEGSADTLDLTQSYNSYKNFAAAFYTINSKYKIAWECADLLIELGGGGGSMSASTSEMAAVPPHSLPNSPPSTSTDTPIMFSSVGLSQNQGKKSRERAITLSGEQSSSSKPGTPIPGDGPTAGTSTYTSSSYPAGGGTPNMAWRASTGRHDLSQRQLVLLREMLNNYDSSFVAEQTQMMAQHQRAGQHSQSRPHSPAVDTAPLDVTRVEYVNREWRWGGGGSWAGGDAMNSTLTLPSEESAGLPAGLPTGNSIDSERGREGAISRTSGASVNKKRRSSRLKGMSGLRDMLRSLTRNQQNMNAQHQTGSFPSPVVSSVVQQSTTSLSPSTESSSMDACSVSGHRYPHGKIPTSAPSSALYGTYGRRRAKTSSGPDAGSSVREREREDRSNSPYTASSLSVKASPRRPSLASIFKIGVKGSKSSSTSSPPSTMGTPGMSTDNVQHGQASSGPGADNGTGTDEEDWDRLEYPHELDSREDIHMVWNGTGTTRPSKATIRGRSPYMQQDVPLPSQGRSTSKPVSAFTSANTSQTSLTLASGVPGVPARATRLSNVEEGPPEIAVGSVMEPQTSLVQNQGSSKPANKTGSVRSMPPQPFQSFQFDGGGITADGGMTGNKLAMTPENIKPLLENAKEVHARLIDCIGEIRMLLRGEYT